MSDDINGMVGGCVVIERRWDPCGRNDTIGPAGTPLRRGEHHRTGARELSAELLQTWAGESPAVGGERGGRSRGWRASDDGDWVRT